MKDSTLLGIAGMGAVSVCYCGYMISHAVAGLPVQDGAVLGGVVGAICTLAGVLYGFNRAAGNGGTVTRVSKRL